MKKLKIIVGGYIGLYPTGGATIDYIQYPLGLKQMGHDVYYIEDTAQYPVYQQKGSDWNNASACVAYLRSAMEGFGMKDQWAYRDVASGECFGMSLQKVLDVCRSADIFINVSCSTYMRDEYYNIPCRILIDSDPMFTQVTYLNELEGDKSTAIKKLIDTHNYLFTFGENMGEADCSIPTLGMTWIRTRQPICLDLWQSAAFLGEGNFTSVMNWSEKKKLRYKGEEWGQKDIEFDKYMSLPLLLPQIDFEVIINPPVQGASTYDPEKIKKNKWKLLHPKDTVADHNDYKKFIQNSFAEFSVAKETYVKSNGGWFSCRSACYLAAGKPVVAEDTGWSKYLPSGTGLFAFNDIPSAVDAIKAVAGDSRKHSNMAKEIAHHFFDSRTVLTEMINNLK